MRVALSLTLFLLACHILSAPLHGEALSHLYATEAQQKALGQDETWLRLLFYERHSLVRGTHGLIDDPTFYLSPMGKTDAQTELDATLEAFFQAQNVTEPDTHPLCRFPARRSYLEQHLPGLATSLPQISCPRFETWWKDRRYESVSLVFSAFFPDNPASMFGHIFLRLHRSKQGQSSDLLDDSINFAAFTNTTHPLLYHLRGAFGGFPGRFSLMPYYMKIQEYNNLESRDLWEYPLQASQDQIKRLLLSLWEFGPHYADYYYFDDNCSYVMLMLMETADISWDFTSQLRVWATPSACMKAVADQPQLMRETRFRPSALSRYQERFDAMSEDERQRFAELIKAGSSPQVKEQSVRTLDAALEYIDFREKLAGDHAPVRYAGLRDSLLLQRTQNHVAPPSLQRVPEQRDPRSAVPESWLMLSGASRADDSFVRLGWQPVLHDLLGDDRGYADNMQLQIMPMSFSYDLASESFNLDKIDLINIISVQPYNRFVLPRSWMFQLGYDRQVLCQSGSEASCPEARLNFSYGAATVLGKGSSAPVAAGFISLGGGAERWDQNSHPFVQAGPEFLVHGSSPWSQLYALRGLAARRWNQQGYADWYFKAELQTSLHIARLQQARLQASWEQINSDRDEAPQSDIQFGVLQHF